ncbi:hypothetical protein NU195Hw_Modified_617t1 [Hortaea werneckii]
MCYTTTQYHTRCQHYGTPLVHGEPCIRALTATGHKSRGCWDATDLGVKSVGSLCPGCAKVMLVGGTGSATPTPLTSESGSESESGDYFSTGGAGLQGVKKVGSESSLSSMGSRSPSLNASSSSSSSTSIATSTSSSSVSSMATESTGGKNLEPPNLHWRTFGGSQVSVRFKRNVSAPAPAV